jgi:uncharacterized protein YebE (UPF0316 family)
MLEFPELPEMAVYAGAVLVVFFLRLIGVAIGTVRILLTNRGNELWSGVLGFFEVLVYVVGIGVVVQDLTDIPILLSYCFGFSAGTILGIRIEQRMALGFVNLRTISRNKPREIAEALREAGFGATLSHGEGRDGTVGIITATVQRKHSRRAMRLVQELDPDAFMVADEARAVARGWLPSASTVFPVGVPGMQRPIPDPPIDVGDAEHGEALSDENSEEDGSSGSKGI